MTTTPQTMGQQFGRRSWAEPWKIKMVEPLTMTDRAGRVIRRLFDDKGVSLCGVGEISGLVDQIEEDLTAHS